jgi:hypothetical protein
VAAVTTQIDDRNVVAGPRVPLGDLMQRCATDGFSKATRLLTYNIKAMSDTPDGVKVIKAYFNKQFHEQAMLLTEVLQSLNLFNSTILNAIHRTPRHMLLQFSASKRSGRGVACLKATSRLTRKASAIRSTGTPASCSREARARRKGLISSPELPHAFIGSTGSADGRCWSPGWGLH